MGVRVGEQTLGIFGFCLFFYKTDLSVMGVRVGVAHFFLDQSIGIDETNFFWINR